MFYQDYFKVKIMKKYGKLYSNINNLLSYLRASNVVKLVNDYYMKFGNDAPAKTIQREMDELQKKLDNAE